MEQRKNAGYTITDSIHIGGTEFVLGEIQTSCGTVYVTWMCENGRDYFWGHYLDDRQAAEKDLLDRAAQELEYQARRKESAEKADCHKDKERE